MVHKPEILLTADIHIFKHKQKSERLYDCLDALTWVFESALKENIEHVCFLGDLFHHRYSIHVPAYQMAYEVLRKYAQDHDIKVWLLVGNHDMWYHDRWDVSAVIPLGSIPNVTVINKPCTLDVAGCPISFLPYTANPPEDLKTIQNENPYKILLGHAAIDGALYNVRTQTYAEVPIEQDGDMIKVTTGVFKGWDRVFLGHYHTPQRMDEVVEYVGSPLELCFNDVFQEKHLVIFDLETHITRYVNNTVSPRHIISTVADLPKYDLNNAMLSLVADDLASPEVLDVYKTIIDSYDLRSFEAAPIKKVTEEEEEFFQTTASIKGNEAQITEKYIKWAEKEAKLDDLKASKLKNMAQKIATLVDG